MTIDRRTFVLSTAAAAAARGQAGRLRFGLIADLHHGLAPDASERLAAFMAEVAARPGLDFIIQLGDFCHPTDAARPFVDAFHAFDGPCYHVLGNHDMDKGGKADILGLWGAPGPYYAFAAGGWRFIVLDLNHIKRDGGFIDYEQGNYFAAGSSLNWAGTAQLEWLADELRRTDRPTIVFAHQPIGAAGPGQPLPEPQRELLEVLRHGPVVACLYGHLHVDRHDRHHGIHCLGINSASYHWSGGMHPYTDPLYAFVELADGELRIEGRWSSYSATDPRETTAAATIGADPWISDRRIALGRNGSLTVG